MSRKRALSLATAALSLLAGASSPPPSAPQPVLAPCPGLDLAPARAAIARVFTDAPETRAIKLVVDGCPAVTAYAPGYRAENRFISWSMAKTVTAMLVGALVADGRLKLDAPVPLAEWRRPGDPHGAITLRQMLNMESGVRHIEVGDPVEKSDTNQVEFVTGSAAMAAAALAEPMAYAPGTHWEYNTLTAILLSEIVTRTLTPSRDPRVRAEAYRAFAEQRLFGPAGVTSAVMEFDGSGTQVGGSLIHMTLDDWARMGALLVDGRSVDGRQVIAPEWLAFMKTPAPHSPEYGGQTWLNHPVPGGKAALFPGKGPDTLVAMNGHLGQFVFAASGTLDGKPHRLVLVRLGNTSDKSAVPLMDRLGDVVEAVLPRARTR